MRILALDAALARCSAGIVVDGVALATRIHDGARAQALLPGMAAAVLAEAGAMQGGPDAVAVTVGPGSFTGLRAAIALAHGLALAWRRPAVAVTVAEALRAEAARGSPVRPVWVAIDSRRARVFLDTGDMLHAYALDDLPLTAGPVALAGDGAALVAERMAARGDDVRLTGITLPEPCCVARVAELRLRGVLAALAAQPLYVDPPEAKLPATGLRPPPAA